MTFWPVVESYENQRKSMILMKFMDFEIFDMTISRDAPLQTVGQLIPPRKRAFLNCFRKFETQFSRLSRFGWLSTNVTVEVPNMRSDHRNHWKSMDFIKIIGFH